jgi:thioesterase domain-containing protein
LKGPFPHHILHLWSLSAELDLRTDQAAAQTQAYFQTLLSLAQAINSTKQPHPVQLSVLSNGAYSLLGTEALNPLKSLLVGAIKVISRDFNQIIPRYLDLEEALCETLSLSQWVQILLTELSNPNPPLEIAYRGRSQWIPIYEPTPLPAPVNSLHLRPQGVYLITSERGKMGRTLARYLAQTFQAALVLLSPTALPERSSWESWCATHPETDAIRRTIQQVQALEACGATVWLGQVKLTDAAAVQELVISAEEELGTIRGIIHDSELEDFGDKLQDPSHSKTDLRLIEYVTEILVLDQIFRDRPLDFWVMGSSLNTVLYKTSTSQAVYSAANEFSGAFCQYKQQTNQTFSVAIHWPEWEEGTTDTSLLRRLEKDCEDTDDLIAMTTAEGIEVFARILSQSQAQIMVTPENLNRRLHLQSDRKGEPQRQTENHSKPLSLNLASLQSQRGQQSPDLQNPEQSIPPATGAVNPISEKQYSNGSRPAESNSANGFSVHEASSHRSSNGDHLQPSQQSRPSSLSQPRVVELQPGCPGHPPLFFVHPASGGVSDYTLLARHLNPDWPFFALQAIGLESETSPLHSLTQMATRYVETIRSQQPTGPYYLGGWSMGGVVAYEMGLQLLQGGESVGGLILIDSPAPVAMARDVVTDFNVFAKGLGFFLEQVKELSQSLRFRPSAIEVPLQRLLEEGLRLNTLPQHFTLEQLHLLYMVFDAHSRALSTYTALPCPKRMPSLFLQAQVADNPQFSQLGPQATVRWSKLLGRSLLSRTLPGDHYSLMVEPQVKVLSTYINGFLQQVRPAAQRMSDSAI